MSTNTVFHDELPKYFIELNEVKVVERPTGRNVNLTEFNKNILQYVESKRVRGHRSIQRL